MKIRGEGCEGERREGREGVEAGLTGGGRDRCGYKRKDTELC